ncbi:MAG: glycoside hydrolase family 15 protein [Pseudomonadota bacterium]
MDDATRKTAQHAQAPEPRDDTLELGVIGNGSISGLIDGGGRYRWMCLPRLDGKPVFDSLLGGLGEFSIELDDLVSVDQSYLRNTAVLRTVLTARDGAAVEILDFAPRFLARGRMFRPMSFVRRARPLSGAPLVRIRLRPRANYGAGDMPARRGVNHIAYRDEDAGFRLTTDAPISYITNETVFVLDRPLAFVFGPDESLSDAVDVLARDWQERTEDQWRTWSLRLAIPPEWQQAVIRAAITLKQCVYEETGGIVAALTSSVPEHEGSERNWDYRFCWLRDSYFTVTALNRLSAVGTLETYLRFLRNIVAQTKGGHIRPVYGVSLEAELTERIADHLPGFGGAGPVRYGNQASEHIQHDVYGHVILGASQAFFDERLKAPADIQTFKLFEQVGERAYAVHDTPDAGIWEYRTRAEVHVSSALMSWAACDRLGKIAARLGLADRAALWSSRAAEIHQVICAKGWSEKRRAFTGAYGGEALDASVLLMMEVGFLPPSDPRFVATVEAIDRELREDCHVFRYRAPDDFGAPQTAFTACTFWHIDALASIGRADEAREMFEHLLSKRTKLGLLSEDIDPATGRLWGNFPQTYSMVGIINSAARLSRPWTQFV